MGSILNLLFEEWNDINPIPNGNKFGCSFPYCSEYIQTNNIKIKDIDDYENIYFPVCLNNIFFSIFEENFFSPKVIKLIKDKKIKILLLREHEGGGDHKLFFKKLYEFILKNDLTPQSFYLYFANKNLLSYYENSIGNIGLNVNVSDWLLEHTSLVINRALETNKINELGYKFELSFFNGELNRNYNFLCLNRIPKAHRVAFLAKLFKEEIIYTTDWSLLFSPYDFTVLYGEEKNNDGKNIFSIEHFSRYFDRNSLEKHEKHLKYFFFTKKKSHYEPISKNLFNFFGDTKSTHFKESYENSYCSLITETSYENNEEHLTEKSFKPFANLHLGIFLSSYKHLERLRGYGFQTFSNFWDESYDEIIDPKERMDKIIEIIKTINNKNLSLIYKKSREVLEYNQSHLLNFWKRESCKKYFKNLLNGL